MSSRRSITVMALGAAGLAACEPGVDVDTSRIADGGASPGLQATLAEDGRAAYETYCAGCHGSSGDGNGPAAGFLSPRPRNFQRANFKFSSTRAGNLPTDEDLKRTIRGGLRGSSMPDWPLLSDYTVAGLIAHIKTFSAKWRERPPAATAPIVDDPYRSLRDRREAIQRGEAVYHGFANCWSCHPAYVPEKRINEYLTAMDASPREGFRPGLTEPEAKVNAEGELVYPPDFRRDFVRAGMQVDDLYRSIAAGITGTAMPTWIDAMEVVDAHGGKLVRPQDIWAMAYYVQDLIRQRPARLESGQFTLRNRPQRVYLNGEIPPPVEEPASTTTGQEFEEE